MFIAKSYFSVPKSSPYFFVMKILSKRELTKIAFNHSSDIELEEFM